MSDYGGPVTAVDRALDEVRSLRFVAEHNRRKGEVLFAVRRLDQIADVLEDLAADASFHRDELHDETEAHQVTKFRLDEAIAENQRLQATARG